MGQLISCCGEAQLTIDTVYLVVNECLESAIHICRRMLNHEGVNQRNLHQAIGIMEKIRAMFGALKQNIDRFVARYKGGNKVIQPSEYIKSKIDANGDGTISVIEYTVFTTRTVRSLDALLTSDGVASILLMVKEFIRALSDNGLVDTKDIEREFDQVVLVLRNGKPLEIEAKASAPVVHERLNGDNLFRIVLDYIKLTKRLCDKQRKDKHLDSKPLMATKGLLTDIETALTDMANNLSPLKKASRVQFNPYLKQKLDTNRDGIVSVVESHALFQVPIRELDTLLTPIGVGNFLGLLNEFIVTIGENQLAVTSQIINKIRTAIVAIQSATPSEAQPSRQTAPSNRVLFNQAAKLATRTAKTTASGAPQAIELKESDKLDVKVTPALLDARPKP